MNVGVLRLGTEKFKKSLTVFSNIQIEFYSADHCTELLDL